MKRFAIIVAGGSGSRMKSDVPKQFLEIGNLPVLMHTINAFYNYSPSINLILVLPERDIERWNSLCHQHNFTRPVSIQEGGSTRHQSVKNGLSIINEEGIVAIHDGVRPFISREIIDTSFSTALLYGSAITSVMLKESIREVEFETNKAVDRHKYRLIQTPQTFLVSLIKEAYKNEEQSIMTDDATVAEIAGNSIKLIEGSYDNIKITTPEDLLLAELLLKKYQNF